MARMLKWAPLSKNTTDLCAVMSVSVINTETEMEEDITEFIESIRYGNESGRCIIKLTVEENLPYFKNIIIRVTALAISDMDEDASVVELTFWKFCPVTSPVGHIVGRPRVNRIPIDYSIAKMIRANTSEKETSTVNTDELMCLIRDDITKLVESTKFSFADATEENTPAKCIATLMQDTKTGETVGYLPDRIESITGKVLHKFDNPGYEPVTIKMTTVDIEIKTKEDKHNAE